MNTAVIIKELKSKREALKIHQDTDMQQDDDVNRIAQTETKQLNMCILYLESGATKKFVNSELERLDKEIMLIEQQFPAWNRARDKTIPCKNPETKFKSEMGINSRKKHIKNANRVLQCFES